MKTQKAPIRIITINGSDFLVDAVLTDAEVMLLLKVGGCLVPIENDYISTAKERYDERVVFLGKKPVDFSISIKTIEVLTYEEFKTRKDAGEALYDAAHPKPKEGAK